MRRLHISQITQASATELPYPDEYFDAVFTDPPYYDNVPYSYLSDFFYVWLKRSIGDLYPELFSTPLTPKSKEIVAYSYRGDYEAGKKFFEDMLKKAFREIYRVLKPNGIFVLVYAHKSKSGWETMINSLLESGFVPTASYPINTEMKSRLLAQGSATLSSSIYIVCRKLKKAGTACFDDVKEEIRHYIPEKLNKFWLDGISGADYFVSAIGSAIEVFGKHEKVIDSEGNTISTDNLLDYVRGVVTEHAVSQILHSEIANELSPLSRFYLIWRWTYGTSKVTFNDAIELANSIGVNLEAEIDKGFIKREKEHIRVVGPDERSIDDLKDSTEMIDVLHYVLLLYKQGKRDETKQVLLETGYGVKDIFFRFAQAVSETLPDDSKEKKLLDMFLSGRDGFVSSIGNLNERNCIRRLSGVY